MARIFYILTLACSPAVALIGLTLGYGTACFHTSAPIILFGVLWVITRAALYEFVTRCGAEPN